MKAFYARRLKTAAFGWAACFMGLLLFYLFVLAPQEKSGIQTQEAFIQAKQLAQSAREAAKKENRDKLLDLITKMENTLEDFLFGEENIANLTFDIDRISNDIQLDSSSITAKGSAGIVKIANCEHLFTKNVNVDFVSNFNKFAAFVNALERSRPVILIDKFEIIRSKQNDTNHKVTMELAVLVHRDARPEGIGG
ncbi:MAG: hypothetical protein ACYSWO_02025 [Planctomycetota bacterium]